LEVRLYPIVTRKKGKRQRGLSYSNSSATGTEKPGRMSGAFKIVLCNQGIQWSILRVDIPGAQRYAKVLWQYKGSSGLIAGVPSPDGRHLAIHASATNSNVWMLEGF
jgi:Tol biopolymer transport system component